LQGETLENQLAYWKRQLEGMTSLELPTDRPRPAVQSFRGEQLTFELSRELSQSLHQLSRQAGATIFMTLLAAFQTLLSRETGQEDIVVGADMANRNRKETEDLIGFFVNMLVLRTSLAGDPSFRELLGRVREVALGAYAHQDVPFEMLVEELGIERDLSRNPIFQVVIVLQNATTGMLELPGLRLEPVAVDSGQVPFDLVLSMSEGSETLSGALLYNTDLYEASTIERLLQRLVNTLESVTKDADQRLSNLQLLTEEETKGFSREKFSKLKLSRKDFENLIMEISDTA
jgi:non-ribosomal peptide synthetase component F